MRLLALRRGRYVGTAREQQDEEESDSGCDAHHQFFSTALSTTVAQTLRGIVRPPRTRASRVSSKIACQAP